jgi:hypothetical protein
MKIKNLIKKLTEYNLEDSVNIYMVSTPNRKTYSASLEDASIDQSVGGVVDILMSPLDFHSKEDNNYHPIKGSLEKTLCGIMVPPTDDGSYKEGCDEYTLNYENQEKGKIDE